MKFSANLGFLFPEATTIIEQYQLSKAAGFKAVEHPFPQNVDHAKLLEIKNETGLKVALVNIQLNEDTKFGCASLPDKREVFKQNFQTTLNFAKIFDCKKIHLMSGKIDGTVTQENRDTFFANLKYALPYLEKEGITGIIEPINKYSVPGYFLNDFKFAVETIKSLGSKNLKLMVDIFHLQMIQGNVINSLKDFLPYMGHIQIAQAPDRNEPNSSGELNYKFILAELEKLGYDDFVGLEYKPLTTTVEGLKWISEYELKL
ncbi:hypothetical protein PVAND_002273 [Polypedilum vanderplanki]|uniref:Putative hydroxypyruvate isomerase n=1 Tax=Polypedilum vanderplanki TaxID=319348 RepID=A0A9J6BRY2_POLVA|nr:hypothetical protein PVAND_002273 [Polypedilum vanderplanki]